MDTSSTGGGTGSRPSAVTRRTIDTGTVRLAVLESGAGGHPLLVLHGFCGAKENFEEQMAPLARLGFHVVAPDQRGHGRSDHPKGTTAYGFARFVDDALELADRLGWDRFALLGHSMGGMTAQRLALAHPETLTGLVLMDTSHRPPEMDRGLIEAGRQIVRSSGMKGLVEALREMGGPLVTEAQLRLLERRPGYQEQLDAQTLVVSEDMWISMSTEMFTSEDLLEDLRHMDVPTLVMVGEEDAPFLDASRRMADAIAKAELAVIEGAGHSPQLEAPDTWLEALARFLGTLLDAA